jgi:integrase
MARLEKGRWRIQIMRNGRRLSQVLPGGTPKKVADDIERRMKLDYIDPAAMKKSCPTFRDFANDWLNEVSSVEHSASHLKKNRQLVRDHLVPMIGKYPLNEVTAQHIVELQRFLMSKGYANQSIANVIATASSIFKEAILRCFASSNPASGLKRPRREQRELLVWSLAERDRFLLKAQEQDHRAFLVAAFALTTGLRPMELRGLLRDAIDFDGCMVKVHRQWCSKQNKLVPYTKTREARTVPVPREILSLLADKRHLAMQHQIFPDITSSYGHMRLKPLMRAAGVREIRMHDLRHTFASHLYAQTKDLLLVKDILGHRSIATTQLYLHKLSTPPTGSTDCLVSDASFLKVPARVVSITSMPS